MDKTQAKDLFKGAKVRLKKDAPVILTIVGICGFVGTTVMAIRATPKAMLLMEERKRELHVDKLPPVEVVKTTWRCYVPTAITGAASVGCILKANSISTRRNAALVTAYNLSRTALSEYKDKVVETIGEKKEKAIRESISQDKLEKNPVQNNEIIVTERGTTRCYDGVFGRYFYSDIELINRAINKINRDIVAYNYASLNDFYSELGLEPVDVGDDLGWNIDDGLIDVEYDAKIASDGKPALVIRYTVAPRREFSMMF